MTGKIALAGFPTTSEPHINQRLTEEQRKEIIAELARDRMPTLQEFSRVHNQVTSITLQYQSTLGHLQNVERERDQTMLQFHLQGKQLTEALDKVQALRTNRQELQEELRLLRGQLEQQAGEKTRNRSRKGRAAKSRSLGKK